ncbi:DUF2723 domain-containing protein [bacterium]|nr:DUF2723 domain-containing protein [bacterium]
MNASNRLWLRAGGAIVFIIAFLTYLRTVAPTTSFWDCGEFIACSYTLSVMHPPGAPLYLLIGRLLTLLPLAGDIGLRVNLFSVFVSAVTVLLTYLVIEQLIRRWRGSARTLEDRLILYASAGFGALAFAFSDSFWFNAVEAEVYAFSMFFTALVVWLALYWGERARREGNMLLILIIFYLFGLAIGVHLLNILAFPVVLMIALFHDNLQVRRLLLLITLQAAVPLILYVLFFQFNPVGMTYQQLQAHQLQAGQFLKWFGLIWLIATMAYIYFKDRYVFKVWWIIPGLIVITYSIYYVIYLRAGLAPPINENDPSTWERLQDYLARKQYGEEDMFLTFLYRKADFWRYQVHMMFTRYFGWQFIGKGLTVDYLDRVVEMVSLRGLYGLPFIVGLWGAIHHFFKDWKRALTVLVLFFITGYAIIIYLNQVDPQPRERDYSYVGSFFAFALWIGIGMAALLETVETAIRSRTALKRVLSGAVIVLLFLAVPVNMFAFNFHSHDRSGNYVAYDYSYNMLQSCEEDAILFTNGDNDTFPLWFLQEVYGVRKDVRVVCLSLLNTPWYIKQLRDQEPRIDIAMDDARIDQLHPQQWEVTPFELPVSRAELDRELSRLRAKYGSNYRIAMPDTVKFNIPPTYPENNPSILMVKDLMVLRIIIVNQWRRPVYFATTVSQESLLGLDRYFRLDGLTNKLMPYPVPDVERDILERNLLEKFQYRNLGNPDVYYNNSIIRLFINLRMAFIELSRSYLRADMQDKAGEVLETMDTLIPDSTILYPSQTMALRVADQFQAAGLPAEHRERAERIIPGRQTSIDEQRFIAHYYYTDRFNDYEAAKTIYRGLLELNSRDRSTASALVYMLEKSGQTEKAITFLMNWVALNPGDQYMKSKLDELTDNGPES